MIIIHPGSRHLRVGRASEAFPRTVPHVIARKMTKPVEPPRNLPLAIRIAAGPKVGKKEKSNDMDVDEDDNDESSSDDEVCDLNSPSLVDFLCQFISTTHSISSLVPFVSVPGIVPAPNLRPCRR